MRLNKFIASAMGVSRRQADSMIVGGQVTVNDRPATLGVQVNGDDRICYRGQQLALKPKQYLLLNKPQGYVCSRRQQGDRPTIYELVPAELQHLQVAGRLDADSSGLLLLTNDGEFALQATHPRYRKQKVYEIEIDKPLNPTHKQQIETGVDLEDGLSKFKLSGIGVGWRATMTEGRNRQIRRTFSALGYGVLKLHRIQFGPYLIEDLKPGQYTTVDKRDTLSA